MFEKLNLGMRGHDLNYDTPEQLAKSLNKVGATSVQLALKKSFPWIKGEESLTPALGKYIKKCFDENGVNLSVLGCYINPIAEDDKVLRNQLDWFKANLIFSKYLGADMVGTEDLKVSTVRNILDFHHLVRKIIRYGSKRLQNYIVHLQQVHEPSDFSAS